MFKKRSTPRSRLDVLREVPMFDGLSDRVLARIDTHVDEVDIPAGRRLTSEGGSAYEAFIVAEGVAEVRIGDELVAETTVGELVGEIGVIKKTPRTATVTARTPMRLLVINPREMSWLFEDETLNARVQANVARHLGGPPTST